MFRRHFTIMVLPDAHLRLRRFHLRGSHLVCALAATGLLVGLAVAAPVLGVWVGQLSHKLSSVEDERDRLAERSRETETRLAELRGKLEQVEQRAQRMAYLVGVTVPGPPAAGQGQLGSIQALPPTARLDVLQGEASDLSERGEALERRLATIERAFEHENQRLSRIPTLVPVEGLIGAGYGWRRDPFTGLRQFHRGLDLAAPSGTPIVAPADGIVVKAERDAGFGNVVHLSHGDGVVTLYGHLSEFLVREGDKVRRGQVIAAVGSTGRSTGPHLHYEIHVDGRQVDPAEFIIEQ